MKIPNESQAAGLALAKRLLEQYNEPWADSAIKNPAMTAADWIAELLDSETAELVIDVGGMAQPDGLRCYNCPGNTCLGRCNWYRDLFDAPVGSPDELEIDPAFRAAPELCPLRDPRRAVLVRRLSW